MKVYIVTDADIERIKNRMEVRKLETEAKLNKQNPDPNEIRGIYGSIHYEFFNWINEITASK